MDEDEKELFFVNGNLYYRSKFIVKAKENSG